MTNENGHMCNLDKLYQECRTYRRFLQDPVDNEIIAHALDNARIASCSKNAQPLRYIACVSHSMVDEIRPLCKYGALLPPNVGMPKEDEHPTVFVAVVKQKNASTFADFDAGLAVNQMTTTAWTHGVGSCIMAAFNKKKIASLLDISDDEEIYVLVAFGYPAHKSSVVDVAEGKSLAYYVNDARDYLVPKKSFEDVVQFV